MHTTHYNIHTLKFINNMHGGWSFFNPFRHRWCTHLTLCMSYKNTHTNVYMCAPRQGRWGKIWLRMATAQVAPSLTLALCDRSTSLLSCSYFCCKSHWTYIWKNMHQELWLQEHTSKQVNSTTKMKPFLARWYHLTWVDIQKAVVWWKINISEMNSSHWNTTQPVL